MRPIGFARRRMMRLGLVLLGIFLFLAVAPISVMFPRNHPLWFDTLLLVSFFRVVGICLLIFGIAWFSGGRRRNLH